MILERVGETLAIARGLALIFDMDGVLIDSNPLHIEAWRSYLLRHGLSFADMEQRMHGRRNDEIVSDFFGTHPAAPETLAHGAAKEALFREMMTPHLSAKLVAGLQVFLSRVNGTPLGLASNAEPANIDQVLDGAGLRSRFTAVAGGHEVSKPKPHPEIYLRVAEMLGVKPANCIVFEDSPTGIEAARAAGMRVVGVQTSAAALGDVDLRIEDFFAPALPPWLAEQRVL